MTIGSVSICDIRAKDNHCYTTCGVEGMSSRGQRWWLPGTARKRPQQTDHIQPQQKHNLAVLEILGPFALCSATTPELS